jgi:polynucleotide 5'-hydroxyl-kinase GRC3/NOL9
VNSASQSNLIPPGWADCLAKNLLERKLLPAQICLVLGASDTGKTALVETLAKYLVNNGLVALVDADTGQSHIGPPTTVGWAVIDRPHFCISKLPAKGISFVGDITPTGHLLQLTSAITQCVEQASKAAKSIIIDTPGFIAGFAAQALWWTIQRIIRPDLIIAVQQQNELSEILAGMLYADACIEVVKPPADLPAKLPEHRKSYRQQRFREYFQNSSVYSIGLKNVAVRANRHLDYDNTVNYLVGLADSKGLDIAVGLVVDWSKDKNIVKVRAPEIDISSVRCLTIDDVSINLEDG